MEQSPSWKADWFAASQISSVLWNPKVPHHTHKRPPPIIMYYIIYSILYTILYILTYFFILFILFYLMISPVTPPYNVIYRHNLPIMDYG
jgi:hypothetical protein